jgi:hypothetical protein
LCLEFVEENPVISISNFLWRANRVLSGRT